MSVPPCEVIGCHGIGYWIAIRRDNAPLEEALCEACYDDLISRRPERAGCYAPRHSCQAGAAGCEETVSSERQMPATETVSHRVSSSRTPLSTG